MTVMVNNPNPSPRGFLVTGTDTGIGKTIVSAMLVRALDAAYFKPVQAGLDEPTDTETVRELTGLPQEHFFPERYRLIEPASPHLSAALEGIKIDTSLLQLPESARTLIVEGAGGVMVPLTRKTLFIDVFSEWQLPTIVCARTSLGTINHTLLTLDALRHWSVPIHGVIFVGEPHEENESIIPERGEAVNLGRVPMLGSLSKEELAKVFRQNFRVEDFH